MKKLPFVMLSLLTLPAYAQSMLSTLNQHQDSLQEPQSSNSSGSGSSGRSSTSTPDVTPSSQTISSNSRACEENDQTSLPLAYITSMIQQKNGQLDFIHDPRLGTLQVKSPDMISNCSSMIEWKLKTPEVQGQKAYAVEAKIKSSGECSDEGCSYKVAKVENGVFKEYQDMVFKPTLKGFEECLEKSGVIKEGKVVEGAIYPKPVSEKFTGLDHSGQLLFLSHGPASTLVKPKYGEFVQVNACDHYENAHPQIHNLLTLQDSERQRLDAEAEKLKECKVDEYGKLANFIEKYEGYASELAEVRDRLILEAAQKAAKAIEEGKYTDEDLKVVTDFHKYVVQPKIDQAIAIYEEMLELDGDAKKAKQTELTNLLAQISALGKKPYFQDSHTLKLVKDGKFEDAEKINNMRLVLVNHQRLGAKQDNVVITPGIASQRVVAGKQAFAASMVKERENYEIRTGQTTGKSQYYSGLAQRMRNNIQVRNQNFNQEVQLELQRIQQPNGYCYKYWRNTQKCIQDSIERAQELQALQAHYNKIDEERAKEYDAQAKEYGDLEAQGRRYIATQNGEPVPEETKTTPTETDTTKPTPRTETQQPGTYSFNFNPQQQNQNPQAYQQQASMTPQNYQYPTNPYQNYNSFFTGQQQQPQGYGQFGYQQQQQNYMGMQSYPQTGGQFGFQGSYNLGFGTGYQQPQQQFGYGNYQQYGAYGAQQPQGYWQQPYQAYNMYSMYPAQRSW